MTTANKHETRSHRSYRDKKATIGAFEHKSYRKNPSKADTTPIIERLKKLFGFKTQERG